jgi:hypothetical protein
MTMKYRDVQSSTVARIGYDDATQTFAARCRLPGGTVSPDEYRYAGVPQKVNDQMVGEALRASAGTPGASVGKLFHKLVRDHYPTTKHRMGDVEPAVKLVEATCPHGMALTDTDGKRLKPPCGCRFTTALGATADQIAAAELGYRCCEQGMNWETARARIVTLLTGEVARRPLRTEPPPVMSNKPVEVDPFFLSEQLLHGDIP